MEEERNLLTKLNISNQWDGSTKGRLLVVGTRCFGDMIKWSRHLATMERLKIDWALWSWPELIPVLKRVLPPERIFSSDQPPPEHDAHVSILWIHQYFGDFNITRPLLLAASAEKIAQFEYLRALQPVVGICWQAAEWEMSHKWRRLKNEEIEKLIKQVSWVRWVNLQYQQMHPALINPSIHTWDDTAGVVHNLDAVVSCDTSVPHFSASMGKKTFILHGRAETSVTSYQPFEELYPGVAKNFIPEYGNPNTSRSSLDFFLEYVQKNKEFWKQQ